jgi:hypothetical protein
MNTQEVKDLDWDGCIGWHICREDLVQRIKENMTEQVRILLHNWRYKWEVYKCAKAYDDTGYLSGGFNGEPVVMIGENELTGREQAIADYFTVPEYRKYLIEEVTKEIEDEIRGLSESLYDLKKAQSLEKK